MLQNLKKQLSIYQVIIKPIQRDYIAMNHKIIQTKLLGIGQKIKNRSN